MKKSRRILAGALGTALEWYDFALYGCFATIIAQAFFPKTNHYNAILATFGIFALGFIMRPFGGYVFGHFGDRIGRSKVLIFTIAGMTIPTVLIGILPTYEQIGIAAPILLLIARLIQGFVIGGEYTGALLFIAEDVAPEKRGQTASIAMISAFSGLLAGSIISTILTSIVSSNVIHAWAWRIPFVFAIILGIVGYYLRRFIQETPSFLTLVEQNRIVAKPAMLVFKNHWKQALLAMGICAMTGTSEYLLFTYFPSYIQKAAGLSLELALRINTFGMGIILIIIPVFAYLSDRLGRRPILLISAAGFLIFTIPVFLLLSSPHLINIFLGVFIFSTLIGISASPMAALFIELFPATIRYSGIAISYNIAFAIFGGTAPALSTMLIKVLNSDLAPAILVIISAIISGLCYYFMPETSKRI